MSRVGKIERLVVVTVYHDPKATRIPRCVRQRQLN
jgi:hypothetical protein